MGRIKSFLRWIVTGSFGLVIAACYGIPADYYTASINVNAKDQSSKPIADLKVTLSADAAIYRSQQTDTNGNCRISVNQMINEPYTLTIEDTDGTNNGGLFKTKTVSNIVFNDTNINVVMTK